MAITLDGITRLTNALKNAEYEVENAERFLANKKECVQRLSMETLPCAMQELGLESLTLDTGEKVKINFGVEAKITSSNLVRALNWVKAHGYGGIIKTQVITEYGKGEDKEALYLYDALIKNGLTPIFTQTIHAGTLKSFIKERMASGENIPLHLFSAYPIWVAKIK